MNKWALEKIKSETSLEAKMTRLKLSYFGHMVRRQGSLEKAMPGKQRHQEKRKNEHEMD